MSVASSRSFDQLHIGVSPIRFVLVLPKKALFDAEFTEWYNAAGQLVYAESTRVSTPGVVSLEVPRRTPPELPREISHETPLYVPSRTSPESPRETPRETPQNIPRRTSSGLRGETPPMTPRDVPRSHLASFVEKRATVANTAFGKLVGARPEADIKPKFRRRPSVDPTASVTSLEIQSANGVCPPDGTSLGQPALSPVAQGSSKQVNPLSCLFCNGAHSLERCFKFRDKTFDERKEFVSTKKLCTNCLRVNHFARRCRMAKACLFSGCGQRHHSLLHPPPPALERVETPVGCTTQESLPEGDLRNGPSGVGQEAQCAAVKSGRSRVSLQIVPVRVRGGEGGPEIKTYVFLDNGSDKTLCLSSLAESLGSQGNLFTSPCLR